MTATSKTTSADGNAAPLEATRTGLAHDATAEIESLCNVMLRELQSAGAEDLALRGMVLRVHALNSVVMSVIGDDTNRDTSEMHETVTGIRMAVAA